MRKFFVASSFGYDQGEHCCLYESYGVAPPQYVIFFFYSPAIGATHIEEGRTIAFVFDKLLAVCRDIQKASHLWNTSYSCSYVMNVTYVASRSTIVVNQCPRLTVVTDDWHANSVFVCHVTVNSEGWVAAISIWIDNIRATCGLRTV